MFERFSKEARGVVVGAQAEARRLQTGAIGYEHMLLAVARSDGPHGRLLRDIGVVPERIEAALRPGDDLDPDALAAVGIDLDTVREQADRVFGAGAFDAAAPADPARRHGRARGHIPFSKPAKKALELALREAIRLGDRTIDAGHILLAIERVDRGERPGILARAGVDPADFRSAVEALRADAA